MRRLAFIIAAAIAASSCGWPRTEARCHAGPECPGPHDPCGVRMVVCADPVIECRSDGRHSIIGDFHGVASCEGVDVFDEAPPRCPDGSDAYCVVVPSWPPADGCPRYCE